MAEPTRHDLELPGCTPEPLMAYLKALGILRLVGEQKDRGARGWWKNDVFALRSMLENDALIKFFLEEYKPTPIVGPWAGGSGFFKKDNKKAVDAISESKADRLGLFRQVISSVREIVNAAGIGEKPAGEDKDQLIRRYRRELPDEVVAWMDAVMVLQQGDQGFAPLLGTGGNDGRLDFTQNFMQRLVALELHKSGAAGDESCGWLRNAIFNDATTLGKASVGQFSPGRAGGPNATQGMEGDSSDNPWDFILMLEGAVMLAGAASRRFGSSSATRAAFPFTVRAVAAGFGSPATKDEAESRGELWLPLWDRPMNIGELRQLFGEARSDVSGRTARDGVDFARAVSALGVDRGIRSFTRLGFLKRSGKAFLAAPLGRFAVAERREVDLLREIDAWLDRFRRSCSAKDAPGRFGPVLRGIDSAVFDFCRYGGAPQFQRVLVALGQAERELGTAERFRDKQKITPIAGLSHEWLAAADDGSPEFRLAIALASVHDAEQRIGPLRANLEAVDWARKKCRAWAEKDRSVVWNAADLPTNLASVLQRRLMDAARHGCTHLPLASFSSAPLDVVAAFLADELDEERVEGLMWGLMLVNGAHGPEIPGADSGAIPLPRDYALLKLLFLPRPLAADQASNGLRWRLARTGETGIPVRPEPRILPLLRVGRVGEACKIGAHRLRVSALPPSPGPLPTGIMRDGEWVRDGGGVLDPRRGQRLAAALLIPISSESVNHLVHLVCCDQSAAAETFAVSNQGDTE